VFRPPQRLRSPADVSTLYRTQSPLGFQSLLIGQRGEGAIRRMAPLTIIEHFNIFKDCRLGLLVCIKVLQRDACGLYGVEEALCHRVGPTVALAAHARLEPVPGEELPGAVGAILTAPVGRHKESHCRLTRAGRHR
jgi:hypothetical protein